MDDHTPNYEEVRKFQRWLDSVRAQALREAGDDFIAAARAGIEPALNLTAGKILHRRAERIEAGEPAPEMYELSPPKPTEL